MSEIMMTSQQVLPRAAERQGDTFERAKLVGALATVMTSQPQAEA